MINSFGRTASNKKRLRLKSFFKRVLTVCNEYFDRVEMPYCVNHTDIQHTILREVDAESGASHHIISAKHKTDSKYSDIQIYTMSSMKYMTYELKKFSNSKLCIKDYSNNRFILELWIVVMR